MRLENFQWLNLPVHIEAHDLNELYFLASTKTKFSNKEQIKPNVNLSTGKNVPVIPLPKKLEAKETRKPMERWIFNKGHLMAAISWTYFAKCLYPGSVKRSYCGFDILTRAAASCDPPAVLLSSAAVVADEYLQEIADNWLILAADSRPKTSTDCFLRHFRNGPVRNRICIFRWIFLIDWNHRKINIPRETTSRLEGS